VGPKLPPPDELDAAKSSLTEGEEMTVFRVTRSDDQSSEEFVDSFRSHAELGIPPVRGSPDETHPQIYDGISVFDTQARALATARSVRRAGRDIGAFVTEVHLHHRLDVRFLYWGSKGHLTLWGDCLKLVQAAVDTIPIEREGAP
jgi:hypothetical protein